MWGKRAWLLLLVAFRAQAFDVAVTVDDLPMHGALAPGQTRVQVVESILATLRKHGVTEAYGFLNAGITSPDGEEAIRRWLEAGQPLANHTYSHLDLNEVEPAAFIADIARNEAALEKLQGIRRFDYRYFRYPSMHEGETRTKREAIRAYLAAHGYRHAPPTADSTDWGWTGAFGRCAGQYNEAGLKKLRDLFTEITPKNLALARELGRRITGGREIKQVLLVHASGFMEGALDSLLAHYKAEGARWVPLAEVYEDPLYSADPDVVERNGRTLLGQWMNAKNLMWPVWTPRVPQGELDRLCH